jgi:hypothetical protein
MNTTSLIDHWSMSDARRDVAGRFRSLDDIRVTLVEPAAPPALRRSDVLVKQADDEDWEPLVSGVSRAS